jgi:predicted AlkP superfamily pyrophosphatase or phosphodiesterase
MQRVAVINVVGLCRALIGAETPRIKAFSESGACARIIPTLPAVTCTAQSTYLTGQPPSVHGIVGNGWYNRQLAEVQFWKQSNHLVHAPKIWEEMRGYDSNFTCANLFLWYNMYSTVDYSITPRPSYPADGRKIFDIYTWPFTIRPLIKKELGEFPFATFWGPAAGLHSPQGPPDAVSTWISASAKWIEKQYGPTLSLIYLPHLDYNLQRHGPRGKSSRQLNPSIFEDLRAVDRIVGDLLDFFASRSVRVVLLSEYGIAPVESAIHLNRKFREKGWLTVKEELGLEVLDCGASKVFAVADHQVAHIYLNDASLESSVRHLLENTAGIALILGRKEKAEAGLDHERAGDLVAVSGDNAWFSYYYWLDDAVAPDFARTVDIHRKPGYDPVELFLDPNIRFPKLKIARRLLQKKLGFRMLMDVIPLDASLVKGSHGCRPSDEADFPVLITQQRELVSSPTIAATDVFHVLKRHFKQ